MKQKKADKTETKSRVTHLKKTLRKKCEDQDGVNPFEFLINPQSYSQTIENLFDMSFIMKEGFAQMDVNETTEQPVLSYVSSAERTRRHTLNNTHNAHISRGQQAKTNGQCIVKFNPSTFCNLINIYNINQSQIQRADANMSSDDQQSDQDKCMFLENCRISRCFSDKIRNLFPVYFICNFYKLRMFFVI